MLMWVKYLKILGVLCLLSMVSTFALAQSNSLCSNTKRGSSISTSYNDLYPGAQKSRYSFTQWNASVPGALEWFNNFSSCSGIGAANSTESANWNSYRSSRISAVQGFQGSYSSQVSAENVTRLQHYIVNVCGLPLTIDGRIGVQTLHAVDICRTLITTSSSLPTDTPSAPTLETTVLTPQTLPTPGGIPEEIPVTVNTPSGSPGFATGVPMDDNNFDPQKTIKEQASKISSPFSSSCFAAPANYTLRYGKSIRLIGGEDYSSFDSTAQDESSCSCKSGARKLTKTLADDKGNPTSYSINVCETCNKETCNCGVKLNTDIPFIGKCILFDKTNDPTKNGEGTTTVNSLNAFPLLMGALIKLLMSLILIACLGVIIVGGFMMTVPDKFATGKSLIMKVVYTIVGLGLIGLILYLINPNFFS